MFTTNPLTANSQNRNLAWRYRVIVVRDLQSTYQISNPAIRELIQQRINDLGGEAFDTEAMVYFVVVEAGDTIEAINGQVGFNILHNRFTGIRFDATGFTPSFEFIEELPSCFDMVFVLDDSGFGVEFFVPREEGIDTDLLAVCRMYAFRSPPEEMP
jgi:hypothetical protein